MFDRDIHNPALDMGIRYYGGEEFVASLLSNLITLGFIIGVVITLFIFLIGAVKWITSGEDREQTAKARQTITNGAIGLVVLFLIYAILKFIAYFFGLELLTIDLGPLMMESY